VITGIARHRRFSTDLMLGVVAETMPPGMSISYVAPSPWALAEIGVPLQAVDERRGPRSGPPEDEVVPAVELRRLEERVRDLERLLARKTMENEILKEALDLARALGLARSNITERVKGVRPKRRPHDRAGDLELISAALVDVRPTLGTGGSLCSSSASSEPTVLRRSTPNGSIG